MASNEGITYARTGVTGDAVVDSAADEATRGSLEPVDLDSIPPASFTPSGWHLGGSVSSGYFTIPADMMARIDMNDDDLLGVHENIDGSLWLSRLGIPVGYEIGARGDKNVRLDLSGLFHFDGAWNMADHDRDGYKADYYYVSKKEVANHEDKTTPHQLGFGADLDPSLSFRVSNKDTDHFLLLGGNLGTQFTGGGNMPMEDIHGELIPGTQPLGPLGPYWGVHAGWRAQTQDLWVDVQAVYLRGNLQVDSEYRTQAVQGSQALLLSLNIARAFPAKPAAPVNEPIEEIEEVEEVEEIEEPVEELPVIDTEDDPLPPEKPFCETAGNDDLDNDGLTDKQECKATEKAADKLREAGVTNPDDVNGNLIPNWEDPNADGDAVPAVGDANQLAPDGNTAEGFKDEDNDGIPAFLDRNDHEKKEEPVVPFCETAGNGDFDGDGLSDLAECDATEAAAPKLRAQGVTDPFDRDGDGIENAKDPNADGDTSAIPGINLVAPDGSPVEGLKDVNQDGIPAFLDPMDGVLITATQIVIYEKVFFEVNSDIIKPESYFILDQVVRALKDNPSITKVQVEGHTDDVGDNDFNLTLSQNRADAVKKYLTDRGIESDRLVAVGKGEMEPLTEVPADSPTYRKATPAVNKARDDNRRVDFKIITE